MGFRPAVPGLSPVVVTADVGLRRRRTRLGPRLGRRQKWPSFGRFRSGGPLPFWWAAVCLFLDGRVRGSFRRGHDWCAYLLRRHMFAWSRGSFIDKVAHLWPLPFWWAAVCLFLDGRVRAAAATARGSEWLTVALFICRGGGLSRGLGGRVRALPQPPLLRHRRFASLVSRLRVALSLSKGLLSHGFGGRKRAPSQPPHTAQNGSRWLSLFTGGQPVAWARRACARACAAATSSPPPLRLVGVAAQGGSLSLAAVGWARQGAAVGWARQGGLLSRGLGGRERALSQPPLRLLGVAAWTDLVARGPDAT